MRNRLRATGLIAIAVAALVLSGCATHYRAGEDRGVYYQVPEYRTTRVVWVDPLVYSYWSLDYFYYSHYYHPYSVVVHRYDPWYYPYPGWYYGYRPGPRHAGYRGRHYYPWYRFGNPYAGYHPWRWGVHFSFGYDRYDRYEPFDGQHRVRQLDARLHELETRRSLAVRSQRPEREGLPAASPWLPATGRGTAVRRDDRHPPPPRPGPDAVDRGIAPDRQALLERLRAAERRSRLPERGERYRDRPVTAPPSSRPVEPRRRDSDPPPPSRSRPVDPGPPATRPQRRSEPPPARTRPPRQNDRPTQRERE